MAIPESSDRKDPDTGAPERKKDHIDLAFRSAMEAGKLDTRFYYEPVLAAHPCDTSGLTLSFAGKRLGAPVWISSMTGGTAMAKKINENLARACGDFRLGMGLGSCRQLLYSDEYLEDFRVRKLVGDQPLWANLGIAQVEQLVDQNKTDQIRILIDKLEADGLIIHINPMQEWFQPEGDRFRIAPVETIARLMEKTDLKIMVKEVGQGMGPESLRQLMKLPLEAIDFGAAGGTNFSFLEILRASEKTGDNYSSLAATGHTAEEMTGFVNRVIAEEGRSILCRQVIVSGGISGFLDGYYHLSRLTIPAVYGQASSMLKYAINSYESLCEYVDMQLQGLAMAKTYLKVK